VRVSADLDVQPLDCQGLRLSGLGAALGLCIGCLLCWGGCWSVLHDMRAAWGQQQFL
jgi:hypothetical protein